MLLFLKSFSLHRSAWLFLASTAFFLELIALYMQHFMHLRPCVMCIYERTALFGIMFAGLLGAIAPTQALFRFAALILWLYSAVKGLILSWQHTQIQLHPSPFNSCDFFVKFPSFFPADKWLPSVFRATGDCAERQWQFLQLQMPQWLIIIFTAYLLVCLLIIFSQFKKNH